MMNFRSGTRTRHAVMTGLLVMSWIASNAYADDLSDANETISLFKQTDPGLARFFETGKVLSDFKAGNLAFSGQVSSVALAAGASADANLPAGSGGLYRYKGRADGRG
jgi:hypothetical protein